MSKKKKTKAKKKAPEREKKPVGRPAWEPSAQLLEAIKENAKLGLWDHQIATRCGINPKLFSEYKQRHESIRDALEEGRADAIAEYSQHLYSQSQQGKTQATLFFLRVHGGWRDNAAIATRSDGDGGETLSRRILDIVQNNCNIRWGRSGQDSAENEVQK